MCLMVGCLNALADDGAMAKYYEVGTVPIPEGLIFEPGGMVMLKDGRLAVATRYGRVYFVDGLYEKSLGGVKFHEFAFGLHEPLGLALKDGDLFVAQRSEITRLRDVNGDDVADGYETYAKGWGVSGNYHEYAFGPVFDSKGNGYVTLNINLGKSYRKDLDWRGWSMRVGEGGGKLEPWSAGMRSPSGILMYEDELFFTDQQGNWVGTCTLMHARKGDFHGHVDSLRSSGLKGATVARPKVVPQGKPMIEVKGVVKSLKLPAVWFPYKKTGMGQTGMVVVKQGGKFGPFEGQILVGDFTMSNITRVSLEKVGGEYQGVVIPFLDGFDSAVFRLAFGKDGSLFVGETNRGWNSLGTKSYGLQRVRWTGEVPFEMKTVRAKADGFEIEFTKRIDARVAMAVGSYSIKSYTYQYHQRYGSDEINTKAVKIEKVVLSEDGLRVRLVVGNGELRKGYVHEISVAGVKSVGGEGVIHPVGYYTLNALPE